MEFTNHSHGQQAWLLFTVNSSSDVCRLWNAKREPPGRRNFVWLPLLGLTDGSLIPAGGYWAWTAVSRWRRVKRFRESMLFHQLHKREVQHQQQTIKINALFCVRLNVELQPQSVLGHGLWSCWLHFHFAAFDLKRNTNHQFYQPPEPHTNPNLSRRGGKRKKTNENETYRQARLTVQFIFKQRQPIGSTMMCTLHSLRVTIAL